MAKYHFNIHGISPDDVSLVLDYISDLDHDYNTTPSVKRYADCLSSSELRLCLRSLPENIAYIVRRSFDCFHPSYPPFYTVYTLPLSFSTNVIESLINSGFIHPVYSLRDVGYNSYSNAINDLPYNFSYFVQRYYE